MMKKIVINWAINNKFSIRLRINKKLMQHLDVSWVRWREKLFRACLKHMSLFGSNFTCGFRFKLLDFTLVPRFKNNIFFILKLLIAFDYSVDCESNFYSSHCIHSNNLYRPMSKCFLCCCFFASVGCEKLKICGNKLLFAYSKERERAKMKHWPWMWRKNLKIIKTLV